MITNLYHEYSPAETAADRRNSDLRAEHLEASVQLESALARCGYASYAAYLDARQAKEEAEQAELSQRASADTIRPWHVARRRKLARELMRLHDQNEALPCVPEAIDAAAEQYGRIGHAVAQAYEYDRDALHRVAVKDSRKDGCSVKLPRLTGIALVLQDAPRVRTEHRTVSQW